MEWVDSKRVRVLYLQPAPLFGGAERQAALSASLLPEFGVDVIPMTGPGQVVMDWMNAAGVQDVVHSRNFPGGWAKQAGLGRATLPWRYFTTGVRARAEMEHLIETRQIDLIYASLPFAWFTGWLAARARRLPIVWRAGGARINLAQKLALFAVTRFMRPNLLLCNSQAVKRTFGPLVPAPVAIVPNGVDANVFHPGAGDRGRYRPPGARYVIGSAGRLTRAKHTADVVHLAALTKKRHPDAHFLIAGEGSIRRDLTELARQLGADNVTFLGFVSDMPSFYAACDLVVLPSHAEGCPNFLLEAMAMAKPIVAARVDPVVELVKPGDAARLYAFANVPAFADALEQLLDNEDSRRALAQRGYKRAQELTARANAGRLAALLRALVPAPAIPAAAPAQLSPQRVRRAPAQVDDAASTTRSCQR